MLTRRVLLHLVCAGIWTLPLLADDPPKALPRLRVSPDHRSLIKEDGTPFFYLGDTAWELFHRLTREEATTYLEDRAKKGFTVIQAVALAEFGGLPEPNRYGHLPLADNDPAHPLEDYFKDVDWVIDKAASLGLYTGFLPTWGDKVNKKWGQGPEIFTPENARTYGEWLGRRYKKKPIIWILGGDRPVETDRHLQIYRALAEGLRAGDGGAHLITYHPMGGHSSSDYVEKEPWLDFNMLQSGHAQKNSANYRMIAHDLALVPPKPVLDGEPNYEDHPVREKKEQGWFDEFDVRKLCYWGLFSGACGHTYGAHPIWQFWDGKNAKLTDPRHTWMEALDLPGSTQVGIARRLLESRPFLTRVPDQTLLMNSQGSETSHRQALRDSEGSWIMVYSALGHPFTVDLTKLSATNLRAWWFDPRTGEAKPAGEGKNEGAREFHPPSEGEGQDWVLVIDDIARNYPAPGSAPKSGQ